MNHKRHPSSSSFLYTHGNIHIYIQYIHTIQINTHTCTQRERKTCMHIILGMRHIEKSNNWMVREERRASKYQKGAAFLVPVRVTAYYINILISLAS